MKDRRRDIGESANRCTDNGTLKSKTVLASVHDGVGSITDVLAPWLQNMNLLSHTVLH